MTAHKHFKQLVRSRMSQTGESYTAARRQLIRDATVRTDAGPARWHLPGSIPATTALRILLTAAGVRDPRTDKPYSEAMLFAICGGIGMGTASFYSPPTTSPASTSPAGISGMTMSRTSPTAWSDLGSSP